MDRETEFWSMMCTGHRSPGQSRVVIPGRVLARSRTVAGARRINVGSEVPESALFRAQAIDRAIHHRLGDLQQVPDREHHGAVGAIEVVATLMRRDRGAAQQVGHIQLGILQGHVFADVVNAYGVRCGGLAVAQVGIDRTVECGTILEQLLGKALVGSETERRIGNAFFHG